MKTDCGCMVVHQDAGDRRGSAKNCNVVARAALACTVLWYVFYSAADQPTNHSETFFADVDATDDGNLAEGTSRRAASPSRVFRAFDPLSCVIGALYLFI